MELIAELKDVKMLHLIIKMKVVKIISRIVLQMVWDVFQSYNLVVVINQILKYVMLI